MTDDYDTYFDVDMLDKSESVSDIFSQLDELLDEHAIPAEYGAFAEAPDFSDVKGELYHDEQPDRGELDMCVDFDVELDDEQKQFYVLLTYPSKDRFIEISLALVMIPRPKGIVRLIGDALDEDDLETFREIIDPT